MKLLRNNKVRGKIYLVLFAILFIWGILFVIAFLILKYRTEYIAKNVLSMRLIDSIEALRNEEHDMNTVMKTYSESALTKCRILAYALTKNKSNKIHPEILDEIAKKLEIEEYYIVNEKGIVEYSNVLQFIGYDMASHPQSAEFLPAIHNPHFEYVQKPENRGIDGKLYQYIGVGREDRPGIVQICYHPKYFRDVYSSDSLSRRMQSMRIGENGFVMTAKDGRVIAAENPDFIGKTPKDVGLEKKHAEGDFFTVTLNNIDYFACYENFKEYQMIALIPMKEAFRVTMTCMFIFIFIIVLSGFSFVFLIRKFPANGVKNKK